jgi:hypothetical protein
VMVDVVAEFGWDCRERGWDDGGLRSHFDGGCGLSFD